MSEEITRSTVEKLYEAYFAGDVEGMLAEMSDSVVVRFLGRGTFDGIAESRAFLTGNTAKLVDLDFRIRRLIVDGEYAAAIWDESAETIHGDPYENHGVDVFRVEDGRITVLHENNDVLVHRRAFGTD
jgi:ketosteroid isomerase-like protein